MKNKNQSTLAASILAEKEKELVSIMQNGSEAAAQKAFNQLYQNRYQGVFNKLKVSLKGKEEDAEDVMQEVFAKVWLYIKSYNGSTNFSTWLYAIAKNTLIDHIRKQKYEIIHVDSMSPTMNDDSDSFKERNFQFVDSNQKDAVRMIALEENKFLVHSAIAHIKKEEMRKIVYLKYIKQLSGKEICEKLNMKVGTYKASNFRAEEFIKNYLLRRGFDPTPFKGQKNPKRKIAVSNEE
jgi:RNA polymerase sigma-70 factor (ECF subfamily)